MKRKSSFHTPSELLALLDQRWKELGLGDGGTYRKPADIHPDKLEQAVRFHSQAHPSDPFAAQRIRLHILQGYEFASEVLADATRIIHAREAARRAT